MRKRVALVLLFQLCMMLMASHAQAATRGGKEKGDFITKREISDILIDYLSEKTDMPPEKIKLGDFRFRDVPVFSQKFDVQVHERNGRVQNGRLSLSIRIVGEKMNKRMFVTFPVLMQMDVVSLRSAKNRGEVLQESDLLFDEQWVSYPARKIIQNISVAVGKQMKRSMRHAGVLSQDYIDILPVVRSGDLVSMVVEVNGVKISARGIARGKGSAGEVIRVANSTSGKIVMARVLDDKSVSVEF